MTEASPGWPTLASLVERQQRTSLPAPLQTSPPVVSLDGDLMPDTALRVALSPLFFQPLLTTDDTRRAEATTELLAALASDYHLLEAHLPSLLRLAETTPFPDVADAFATFLRSVAKSRSEEMTMPVLPRVSGFIGTEAIPPVRTTDELVATAFRDVFVRSGRVSHLNRVLAMHPSYYALHHTTMNTFLRQDGPLPVVHRFYIAILASAQYDCKYLVHVLENEFRLRGGDETWLQGVEHAPLKIRALLPVLMTIAHCPWRLTKDHICELVRASGGNAWSIGELVSAIVISCTFNALAGVAFGTGITEEIDLKEATPCSCSAAAHSTATTPRVGSPTTGIAPSSSPRSLESFDAKTTELMNRLRADEAADSAATAITPAIAPITMTPNLDVDETTASPDNGGRAAGNSTGTGGSQQQQQPALSCSELARYRMPAGIQVGHEEFNVHAFPKFLIQEFSWNEHGYELVSRFFSDAAALLDDLFKLTYNLTYHTFSGSDGISTDRFRQAIWYYVQLIHGVYHDDYEYHQINQYLQIRGEYRLKSYVKMVACTPYVIQRSNFDNMGFNLRPDEKVHVCLLASESHKQVGLLYGLRAVMQFMDSD